MSSEISIGNEPRVERAAVLASLAGGVIIERGDVVPEFDKSATGLSDKVRARLLLLASQSDVLVEMEDNRFYPLMHKVVLSGESDIFR